MRRRIVLVSAAVLILVVAAAILVGITIQSSSGYTNQVGCTDNEVTVIEASVITNASGAYQTYETLSTTTSFTTTTNYSASAGHTTVSTIGPRAESGTGEVYITNSCSFVK